MTYTESARAQLDALQVKDHVRILALETSCDETAVAVVEDGRTVLTDCIASQVALHRLYGGVVPEIASRKHVEAIAGLTDPTGHILGLMPHPEAFHHATNHPGWTRGEVAVPGTALFANAVRYLRENPVSHS